MTKFFQSLLFVLVFLILYGLLLDICERYYERDLSIYQFTQKLERLKKGPPDTTVIIGDSRALAIDFVDPLTPGINSYNYAFSNAGGMYPYPYFIEQLLRHQPPPERIIWSFIPLMLTDTWEIFKDNPDLGSSEFYRSARLYQVQDIFNPTPDSIFIRYHKAGREILRNKLAISFNVLRDYFQEPDNRSTLEDLFNEETGGLIFSRDHHWEYSPENYLEQTPLVITTQAEIFIRNFLDQAQRHDIKVYLLNMPIPEKIHKNRMENGFYRRYFNFIKHIQQDFPETLYVYEKIGAYKDEYFIDGSHLNEKGVRKFQNTDYLLFLNWTNQWH